MERNQKCVTHARGTILSDKFEWDDKYSVGNDEIDRQHKKLFGMVNQLSDLQNPADFKKMVVEVFKYTREHFKLEEEMLIKLNYSMYAGHAQIHDNLITKLSELDKGTLETEEGKEKFKHFMFNWLTDHIMNEDMEYKKYIS